MLYDDRVVTRFWKYARRGDGCWEWQGVLNSKGYGRIYVNGKLRLAHKVAWELFGPQLKPGELVLHRCDNRPCVRPSHLFTGDQRDNILDHIAKHGHYMHRRPDLISHGEQVGTSRLREVDIPVIAQRRGQGESFQKIADSYGVHWSTVWFVVRGKTWKHVKR